MATRRKRPVMYEVVNRGRRARGRAVTWPTTAPAAQPTAAPERPTCLATPPTSTAADDGGPEPSVQVDHGRVLLSLGWPQLTVAGVLAIVVLVAVFWAGRRSVLPPEPEAEITEFLSGDVREVPADRGPVAALNLDHRPGGGAATPLRREAPQHGAPSAEREQPAEPPPDAAPQPTLESGHHYVLVQYFPKSRRQHAQDAARFLRSEGVECTVIAAPSDLRLFATKRFSSAGAAEGLIRQVRELGRQYARAGGGYDFAGCGTMKIQ